MYTHVSNLNDPHSLHICKLLAWKIISCKFVSCLWCQRTRLECLVSPFLQLSPSSRRLQNIPLWPPYCCPKKRLSTLNSFQIFIVIINIIITSKFRAFSMLLLRPTAGFGTRCSGNRVKVSKTPYVIGWFYTFLCNKQLFSLCFIGIQQLQVY